MITRTRAQRILRACTPVGTTVTVPTGWRDETLCLQRITGASGRPAFQAWWFWPALEKQSPPVSFYMTDATSLLMRVLTKEVAERATYSREEQGS